MSSSALLEDHESRKLPATARAGGCEVRTSKAHFKAFCSPELEVCQVRVPSVEEFLQQPGRQVKVLSMLEGTASQGWQLRSGSRSMMCIVHSLLLNVIASLRYVVVMHSRTDRPFKALDLMQTVLDNPLKGYAAFVEHHFGSDAVKAALRKSNVSFAHALRLLLS